MRPLANQPGLSHSAELTLPDWSLKTRVKLRGGEGPKIAEGASQFRRGTKFGSPTSALSSHLRGTTVLMFIIINKLCVIKRALGRKAVVEASPMKTKRTFWLKQSISQLKAFFAV